MTVSPRTEQALRDAMERLFTGKPVRTDGRLTKNNLWREAGVSRATMNRATNILAEWDTRTADRSAGARRQQPDPEVARLRGELRRCRSGFRRLQEQVDAAATVIATLLAENAALRAQAATKPAALVVPLNRTRAVQE